MEQRGQFDLAFPILYLFAQGEVGIPVQIDLASSDHGHLAYFGGDCAAIYTGATYGVTDIDAQRLDHPPGNDDHEGWETVEEATIDVTSPLVLLPHPAATIQSLDELAATQIAIPHLEAGTYLLRVSARGRDVDRSDVSVRLQFWPTTQKAHLRVLAVGDAFAPRSLTSVTPRRHEARTDPSTIRPGATGAAEAGLTAPALQSNPVPGTSDSVQVDVSYHSFLISGRDTDPTATYTTGSVFDAGNNLISVHTGIASGPVDVVVERFDGDPLLETGIPPVDASQWDSIDEVTIPVSSDMWFITLDGEIVDRLGSFTAAIPHSRCFRICVRGRASNWDLIVDEPCERYLVQTWPSGGPSMIRSVKHDDGIWPIEESEAGVVAAQNESGEPIADQSGADARVRVTGPFIFGASD